jgi:hypothetical protein
MLTRLTHAGIAFAITAVLYQGYVLAVAPFVEPPGAARTVAPIPLATLNRAPASLEHYKPVLAAYFAADHWCFGARPPIIVENSQALIVLGEYSQSDSGELRVPHVAIVFFPTSRDRGSDPPRDAIILEPAGGATLQMDQTIGQGKGLGAMGRMQFGRLDGQVVIRSDMKQPGPQDDLRIETRDLYMNEDFIRTPAPVTMRLGQHYGRGRGLEIRFIKTEAPASSTSAALFGKLDTLEITSEVAARIMPGETTLFGEERDTPATPAAPVNAQQAKLTEAPAQITCTGPFHIDFNAYKATFSDDVLVTQLHPDGALDELKARELILYFDPAREWGGDVAPTPGGSTPAVGKVRLEPATLEALGTAAAPVRLAAPSQGAAARAGRLVIELIQRQVTLDGGDEVVLNYRGAEIHAPMLQYHLPPQGSQQRLGSMAALGGGGWLRTAPDPRRPGEMLEVRWTKSMQTVRRGGQPVLVLDGRPRVTMLGLGTLWADLLELYLREQPISAPSGAGAAAGGVLPASIAAERVVATGHVGMQSAELNGDVDQLELRVLDDAPPRPGGAAGGAAATAASGAAGGRPATFDRQMGSGPRRSYFIKGRVLEIDARMLGKQFEVSAIRVDGGVDFQETTPGAAADDALRIRADHLNVTDADLPDAKIEIRGGDATGALPAGLATIATRGMVLRAPMLAVNRGTSQAWINSPGEVQMLMTRDLNGEPLAAPQQLRVTWRDSLDLHRDRLTFQGNVFVEHADGWLRSQQLAVVLTAPVQFDGAASGQPPEAAQLECRGDVNAQFDQRDAAGLLVSHQELRLDSLIVNQITGALRGDGPGHLDSIHASKGGGSWLDLPDPTRGAAAQPRTVEQDAPGPPTLRHLSIDFVRGVEGNIRAPQRVRVFGDVRAIYGPVDSWDQRLEMTPGGAPGQDTFWIRCDSLEVAESPLTRLLPIGPDGKRRKFGLVELKAEGRVVIEGEHPERGGFTLEGHTAAYDQAKTVFMLKGNGATRATITYQQFRGGPLQPQSADSFIYNQTTGEASVTGFDKIQLDQFGK